MTENPWGDTPSTIPPIVSEPRVAGAAPATGRTDRPDRRRIRLAAGIATLVAVGGVAYAQTAYASTATAATTSTGSTSTASGTTAGASTVTVGNASGAAQTTSAGS